MESCRLTEGPLAQVLGDKCAALDPVIAALHCGHTRRSFQGRVTVTRGSGFSGLAARIAGFPSPMEQAPFALEIVPQQGSERWTRKFGEATTTSVLRVKDGQLHERFGPITTVLAPQIASDGGLNFQTGAAWALFLPLPHCLAPRGTVAISLRNGCYVFDITGAVPLFGAAIRYQGWLEPVAP